MNMELWDSWCLWILKDIKKYILNNSLQKTVPHYSTYKTSSPQASQKGVLVSSTGCVDGGLVGDLFHSGCFGGLVEVGDTAAGDAVDGNFCDGLRCGGPEGCWNWTIPGRATGWGCPGRATTGAGGATGMLAAGLIWGGEGRYILGIAWEEGLLRPAFCLSKTLPGASNREKNTWL